VKPKPFAAMTVLFVKDLHELGALVPGVLAYQPDSFESYDDHTFKLATKYFFEFAKQMKSGLIGLGISFLPELLLMLFGGVPKLVLLAEFRAGTQQEATRKAEKLARDMRLHVQSVGVRVAKNERAARKYWVVRRESFSLLRKKVRGKRTAPFIDDFVVPPPTLPLFLPRLQKILDEYSLLYTVAGHVGDGNFHIIPLIDPKDPKMPHVIEELSKRVYDLVLEYQGSISGEHNDGLVRTPFVEQMFGHEMYALFQEVKNLFDPTGIFNPGKKVGLTFAEAASHLDLGV
jgi:FAD/FMN-containing dehydrogenase